MKREIDKIFSKHDDLTENHSIDSIFNALNNIGKEVVYAIESRTCKNCKFIEKESEHNQADKHKCAILMAMSSMESELLIGSGFGCNKFERKGE